MQENTEEPRVVLNVVVEDDDDDEIIPPIAASSEDQTRPRSLSVISASSGDVRLPGSRETTPRPRSRPRRYESPLQQHAIQNMPINFHRALLEEGYVNPAEDTNRAARRRQERDERFRAAAQRAAAEADGPSSVAFRPGGMIILPGAGSSVGANSVLQARINERRVEPAPGLSVKQGPSRRKVRRWDNDRMVGIAAELARANSHKANHRGAQEFARGQAEAVHFLQPNHPLNHTSVFASMSQPDCDLSLQVVRERYLAGEVAKVKPMKIKSAAESAAVFSDGTAMWNTQIPSRLRKVVRKACQGAREANDEHPVNVIKILDALESFMVAESLLKLQSKDLDADTLARVETRRQQAFETLNAHVTTAPPHVTCEEGKMHFEFSFDPEQPKGGFYRLLAHAVSFFHGMKSFSKNGYDERTRTVKISGQCLGHQFRLVDFALAE